MTIATNDLIICPRDIAKGSNTILNKIAFSTVSGCSHSCCTSAAVYFMLLKTSPVDVDDGSSYLFLVASCLPSLGLSAST